jgi:hypothetical protein
MRRFNTPGSAVASMSTSIRERLALLRSSDIASVRRDIVALYVEPDPTRALKRQFDQRLRPV